MADQITINTAAVANISRKLKALEEDLRALLLDSDRTIASAELEGWNDANYFIFTDAFQDTKVLLNNGLKRIEEEHLPMLKRLVRTADEF